MGLFKLCHDFETSCRLLRIATSNKVKKTAVLEAEILISLFDTQICRDFDLIIPFQIEGVCLYTMRV